MTSLQNSAIEDVIERDFSALVVAVFAGINQLLGLAQRRGIDKNNFLGFLVAGRRNREAWRGFYHQRFRIWSQLPTLA